MDEKIYNVSSEVIDAIKKNSTSKFISLIAFDSVDYINKTEEMIKFDIGNYHDLFIKYLGNTKPSIVVTSLYNHLGQKLVKIPICESCDSSYVSQVLCVSCDTIKIRSMHLEILFGPPNIVRLDKISGYKLIENNADTSDFHSLEYWSKRN